MLVTLLVYALVLGFVGLAVLGHVLVFQAWLADSSLTIDALAAKDTALEAAARLAEAARRDPTDALRT